MLAEATAQILAQGVTGQGLEKGWSETVSGLYNLAPSGATSWWEFAQEIAVQAGSSARILPISSMEYATAAVRPENSRLDITKYRSTFHLHVPSWKECLSLCMRDISQVIKQ
jgi:dTDP-4-dehydrorhamnose reductase